MTCFQVVSLSLDDEKIEVREMAARCDIIWVLLLLCSDINQDIGRNPSILSTRTCIDAETTICPFVETEASTTNRAKLPGILATASRCYSRYLRLNRRIPVYGRKLDTSTAHRSSCRARPRPNAHWCNCPEVCIRFQEKPYGYMARRYQSLRRGSVVYVVDYAVW